MNQVAISLVVGLLAGALGAYVVTQFTSTAPETDVADLPGGSDLGDIPSRLDRIERLLEKRMLASGPSLQSTGAEALHTNAASPEQMAALLDGLAERLKPTIQESVQSSVSDAFEGEEGPTIQIGGGAADNMNKKKKVTLAELSAELELSQAEEDEVRRITEETTEKFLKLLADENQTVDDLRNEFQAAKDDPAKQAELGVKYMAKLMTNLGPVISLGMEHDSKMAKAIGKEKADKLDEDYEVTDLDPLGLEAIFDDD